MAANSTSALFSRCASCISIASISAPATLWFCSGCSSSSALSSGGMSSAVLSAENTAAGCVPASASGTEAGVSAAVVSGAGTTADGVSDCATRSAGRFGGSAGLLAALRRGAASALECEARMAAPCVWCAPEPASVCASSSWQSCTQVQFVMNAQPVAVSLNRRNLFDLECTRQRSSQRNAT